LVVEPKEKTKERLKRSPDAADAFNLSFYPAPAFSETVAGHIA
jgi:hypothetical protein